MFSNHYLMLRFFISF